MQPDPRRLAVSLLLKLAILKGFEPSASCVTGMRSNHLSYRILAPGSSPSLVESFCFVLHHVVGEAQTLDAPCSLLGGSSEYYSVQMAGADLRLSDDRRGRDASFYSCGCAYRLPYCSPHLFGHMDTNTRPEQLSLT